MSSYAIILSGGGARGAYEVGVLSYLFDTFARRRGGAPRIDILCGTSVGAINACYLASHLDDPSAGVRRLVDLWLGLRLDEILSFGPKQTMRMHRLLAGGDDGAGIFDVSPIARLVQREIPWRAISRAFRHRRLGALSVSTTEVATGRTVIFLQTGAGCPLPRAAPPRTVLFPAHIGPHHALASAAIPLLFPPVRIGSALYLDGGVRQNTPIAPALRLGATHVLAIGLSHPGRIVTSAAPPLVSAPGAPFLLGKVLNAFLLDHLDNDLQLLHRINGLLADGERAFGPDFVQRLDEAARARGGPGYRRIHSLALRPSEDIGQLASDYLRRGGLRASSFVRRGLRMIDSGGREADLASYLLFDGAFASHLIDLGRTDAASRHDDLLAFFEGASALPPDQGGNPPSMIPPSSTLPPPIVG